MISNSLLRGALPLVALLMAVTASAQQTFPDGVFIFSSDLATADLWVEDNSVLTGKTCMGNFCNVDEVFDGDTMLRFSSADGHDIEFIDTSTSSASPSRDWRIKVNDSLSFANGGIERFSISDTTANGIPFTIEGGAPDNLMWLSSQGRVGFGTMLPQSMLHAASAIGPGLRLEQIGGGGFLQPQTWEVRSQTSFSVNDITGATTPFRIEPTAPNSAFHISETGFIGLGTSLPQELLHIRTLANDTDAFALFEAAGTGSDSAFRLKQNGSVPTTWEFRNQQDSGRLNIGLAGGNTPLKIDNAANNNLLKLGINSAPDAVVVTGRLVVNNTTLNVPDYVFADDYALRPLAEVQAFINENSHLPDVPSEAEIKANGVDMTAMQMTLLKKVEELTLYALELEAARARQAVDAGRQDALIATLIQRLEALETP